MAVGGILIAVYMCVIISMNSSCFMKLCWPNLFQDHGSNYNGRFDGRFTSERSLFDMKSQGLFSSETGQLIENTKK